MAEQAAPETIEIVDAYIDGNREAQRGGIDGAFLIADALGYNRDSPLWNAAVAGAYDHAARGTEL